MWFCLIWLQLISVIINNLMPWFSWRFCSTSLLLCSCAYACEANMVATCLAFQAFRDSLLVRPLDSWSKRCVFEYQQEQQENFLLQSTLCTDWHVKDPGRSVKSACGRLHLSMHTSLTQWSQNGLTMLLSRHGRGPVRKWAHMQFIREHLVTVISAHWATVDWSWPKEWN